MGFHIDYETYQSEYLNLNFWGILMLKKSWRFRIAILRCNWAKPVKLTPSMLLNESGDARRKRAIGISGKQRESRDKMWNAFSKAIISLGGGAIVVSLVLDFSWETLAQWAIRILPVIGAIISGDADGYDDIAVTESNHKREQAEIIKRMTESVSHRDNTAASEGVEEKGK